MQEESSTAGVPKLRCLRFHVKFVDKQYISVMRIILDYLLGSEVLLNSFV